MKLALAEPAPGGHQDQERRGLARARQQRPSFPAVVTNHAHRPVDASPQTMAVALSRLDPLRPLNDALIALGLRGVVSLQRDGTPTEGGHTAGAFSVGWPLPTGHRARARWSAEADPGAAGGSLLSVAVRVGTDDPADAPRLLDAWPLIGPIIDAHTRRLLRSITELAEDLAEQSGEE